MKIADFIIDSRVGALDRTLGFLYGAARGVLIVAVGLLFFNWLVGTDHLHGWRMRNPARFSETIGQRLQALPDDPEKSILSKLPLGSNDEAPPAGGETQAEPAPDAEGDTNN